MTCGKKTVCFLHIRFFNSFRSKVTNYGDFRNGTIWPNARCLGTCKVQYDGQYQITDGFVRASCNGSLQAADKVGFWC